MNPHWKGTPPKKRGMTTDLPPIGKSTWHGNPIHFGGVFRAGASHPHKAANGPCPIPKEER